MYEKELDKLKRLYQEGVFKKDFYARMIPGPEVFDSYEDFQKIPVSYKDELRTTSAYERTSCGSGEVYGIFSSSGTTGEKTYYIYSKEDKKVHEEFVRTFYEEIGITEEDLGAVCAPVDTGVMAHTMMWQFTTMGAGYVNCPEPSPENIAGLVSTLPVSVVATRPDIVSTLAYREDWTQKVRNSRVKKLLLGGGFLSKQRRKLLEKTWNAEVYNLFGMSEMFGPMAAECKKQDGQHYLNNYLMIELLDPVTKVPVRAGEPGIAVYTTLWKKGFPLLRYWTDDLMKISYEPCKCGSNFPRLYCLGRLGDSIKMDDRLIFPHMVEEITMKHGFIWDYQVVQKTEGMTVKVECPPPMQNSSELERELKELFGVGTAIHYVLPGELGYRGHGKRFVSGQD